MLSVSLKSLCKELNGIVMQHSHLSDAHYGFAIGCYATLLHVLYVITTYMVYIIIYIYLYIIYINNIQSEIYIIYLYILYIYIYYIYII